MIPFATRIINNTGIPDPKKIPAKTKLSLLSIVYQKLISLFLLYLHLDKIHHNFKIWNYYFKHAERGIRTPARLRVAVFETAAVLLGYLGIHSHNNSIIKQIKKNCKDQTVSNNSSLDFFLIWFFVIFQSSSLTISVKIKYTHQKHNYLK